jgi:hypothetical protein
MTRELNRDDNGPRLQTSVWAPQNLKTDYTWLDGIMLMRQFMKADREVGQDEYGTPTLEPSYFVDPRCSPVIKEHSNYRSKEAIKGRNVPELGNKIEDHTIDALRYALLCIFKIGCQYALSDTMSIGQNDLRPRLSGVERDSALVSAGAPSVMEGEYLSSGSAGTFTFDQDF